MPVDNGGSNAIIGGESGVDFVMPVDNGGSSGNGGDAVVHEFADYYSEFQLRQFAQALEGTLTVAHSEIVAAESEAREAIAEAMSAIAA